MSKINWSELKQKYYESEIDEVTTFLRQVFGNSKASLESNGNWARNTKNWKVEKQEFKKKIFALAESKTQEKLAESEANRKVEYINKALDNIELKVATLLGKAEQTYTIKELNQIKIGYEILRLATGKSTTNQGGDKENPLKVENIIKKIGE